VWAFSLKCQKALGDVNGGEGGSTKENIRNRKRSCGPLLNLQVHPSHSVGQRKTVKEVEQKRSWEEKVEMGARAGKKKDARRCCGKARH